MCEIGKSAELGESVLDIKNRELQYEFEFLFHSVELEGQRERDISIHDHIGHLEHGQKKNRLFWA